MTIYNTYQKAKIASPEYVIFERDGVFGTDNSMVDYFDMHMCNYKECNPSDYCVTAEEFLKDGYSFVAGDFIFSSISQEVYQVDEIDCIDWNTPGQYDKVRYVLRAAALEKPKRVKVEYVKVEESIFDLKEEFERGDLYARSYGAHEEAWFFDKIDSESQLVSDKAIDTVYRKVETEISERDEFIEVYNNLRREFKLQHEVENFSNFMADSGKFKLVEGE